MKKSSRDYRKNNRQKWVKINQTKMLLGFASLNAAMQCHIIQSSPGLSRVERMIKMVDLSINSAIQFANIINPDYKNPNLEPVESALSELKQLIPA